jgi:glycosyltransferase involved in cell wall biosynthesis
MPVVNEERHLQSAVRRILDQDYPGTLEVIVAVGPSRDRTRQVADRIAAQDARVHVVDNPTGRTPAGLNLAIAAAKYDHVVRVDGHGLLPEGYIATAVEAIERTGADNVGGMMVPEGTTPFERAVAAAMSSRIGIGGARFHVGGEEGPAETVYLGVFRRAALDRLGGFDEHFVRAKDWELNHRIRRSGGEVWFTPALRVTYRPRSSLRALASQFYRTGQWRRQVVTRYPETASVRYLTPPAAVVVLAGGTLAGLAGVVLGSGVLTAGLAAPVGYGLTVLAGSAALGRRVPPSSWPWLPVVITTMHLAWGSGFIRGTRRK